jgi:hypothetical protein
MFVLWQLARMRLPTMKEPVTVTHIDEVRPPHVLNHASSLAISGSATRTTIMMSDVTM